MITQYQPDCIHTMTKNGEPYAKIYSPGYWQAQGYVNGRFFIAEGQTRCDALAGWLRMIHERQQRESLKEALLDSFLAANHEQ